MEKQYLIDKGFTLESCPDGSFWILRTDEGVFMQITEDLQNITFCDNGWVEDNLTLQDVQHFVENINQYKEV